MTSPQDRATAFANHLLSNQTLNNLNALQKEEQILQFLNTNAKTLLPTLTSPEFFPGSGWNEILTLLSTALVEKTNTVLLPRIEQLINEKLSLSFIGSIAPHPISEDKCREELLLFMKRMLQKPEARKALTGPFTALENQFPEKYMEKAFANRQYVHFELIKVQRLRPEAGEINQMIKTTMLLRPSIQLMTVGRAGGEQDYQSGLVQSQFAQTVFENMKEQLRAVPPPLIRAAVFSNVSFEEDKQIEATARIASIFSGRAKNFKPIARVDRGASTPDRSWFSIARRNYKFYGFDVKMLDEFYKNASESGW